MSYTQNGEIDSPLFGELEETSRDLSDLRFETKESWDVCPNSPESGKSILGLLFLIPPPGLFFGTYIIILIPAFRPYLFLFITVSQIIEYSGSLLTPKKIPFRARNFWGLKGMYREWNF